MFWKIIAFYFLTLLVFAASAGIAKGTAYPDLFSMALAVLLTLLLLLLFAGRSRESLRAVGIRYDRQTLPQFFAGAVIGGALVLLLTAIIAGFADVRFERSPSFNYRTLALSVFLYFLVGCREELAFRSYFLWRLRDRLGAAIALGIVVTVFIAEHIITGMPALWAIIGSGMGGTLFGFAALRTGNIALPLGLHFAWNSFHWLFGYKNDTGLFREVVHGTSQHAEMVALAGYVIVMTLGILAIHFWFKPKPSQQNPAIIQ